MQSLEQSLRRLSHWACDKNGNVSLHLPHLQKFYSTEKILSRSVASRIPCYVYYYGQKAASGVSAPSTPPLPSKLLPDFLAGIALFFDSVKDEELLKRHAIAYGAKVFEAGPPDPGTIVISDAPPEDDHGFTFLRPDWLCMCFQNQGLVETTEFEHR